MRLRSIAAVLHKQVTRQARGYWVHHILDGVKLAGWVASPAVDKTRIKLCQPVRNLPGGSLYTVVAIWQMGKCTRDRTNPPHGAFSKQACEMNSCSLNPTWMPQLQDHSSAWKRRSWWENTVWKMQRCKRLHKRPKKNNIWFVHTLTKILEELKSTFFSLKYLNFRKQIRKYFKEWNFQIWSKTESSYKKASCYSFERCIFRSCKEQRSIHSTSRSFQDWNRSQHNP